MFESKMAIYWLNISRIFNSYINIAIVFQVVIDFSSPFERENFVFWPNGTVPFYVNPTHFDKEQSLAILSTLSLFAFKTCLQFRPVMVAPRPNQHVLVLENPRGVRHCVVDMEGHANGEPHRITLGYSCLRSPHMEMIIMKALGFPFEHNRAIRDLYIDVQFENIVQGFIPLFTKEKILASELRNLPYDVNSVMHFGERDYSKNGHRSFVFKNQQTKQSRIGLSNMDLRKIEIIYGPECQTRDRQAKIDICKKYPSVRRKRETEMDFDKAQNLRINRDITPPPEKNLTDQIIDSIKELNIDNEVQDLIEQIHKITASALENERFKICNITNTNTRKSDTTKNNVSESQHDSSNYNDEGSNDLTKIIEVVIGHVKSVLSNANTNLTVFCDTTNSIELFQRAKCGWGSDTSRCNQRYRSTKFGAIRYSTKHRPFIRQSTKHEVRGKKHQYESNWLRSINDTQDIASNSTRKKRDLNTLNLADNIRNDKVKTNDISKIIDDVAKDMTDSSRRKRENKIINKSDLYNVAIETIDSIVPIGNTEKSVIDLKRGHEISYSLDFTDVTTKTNVSTVVSLNTSESINASKIRKKREGDTLIISDNLANVTEKLSESLVTKTDEMKESAVKIDRTDKDVNVNGSKDTLRMATRVFIENKVNFAPARRIYRDDRQFSNREKNRERKSDDSSSASSSERGKRRRTTKRKHSREPDIRNEPDRDREERRVKGERERYRDRDREDRPQKKRSKVKRGKQRHLAPKTVQLTKSNKEFYADRIWPDGVVRYVVTQDPTYNLQSLRDRLAEVNEILKKKTCVRLEEISERQGQKYEDYLVLDASADYVTGRVGGRQSFGSIELFEGGQHRQHAAMMVMAMLGFYFELARHDRDKYVRVHNRHIRPDKLHHFEKIRPDATLDLPYDYRSATHPAWQFWRRVGRTGISTVATYKDQDPDGSIMKSLGQNEELLSDGDIIKINSVYGIQCFQKSRVNEE